MAKKNDGILFEKLTESIFQKLRNDVTDYSIEHNVLIDSPFGKRQFDIVLRSKIAGFDVNTAIECKDHNSRISIKEIDNFESKLRDVNIQKGILISRKGFSSKAISKAKSVNISLCTAHQALSENWKVDLNIPVFIKQIQPIRFSGSVSGLNLNTGDSFFSFPKVNINDINVVDCFNQNWESNRIILEKVGKKERIYLPEITSPYFIDITSKDGVKMKREVSDFSVIVNFEIKYFSISINDLKETQVLKDITADKTQIFLNLEPLTLNDDSFNEIKNIDFEKLIGLSIIVLSKPTNLKFDNWHTNLRKM